MGHVMTEPNFIWLGCPLRAAGFQHGRLRKESFLLRIMTRNTEYGFETSE